MAKFRTIKNSFLGGQISPTAEGRTDLPQYPHSCKLLQNVIPMLSGGGYRRPGTLNMDTLSSATDHPLRLIDFVDSRQEAYCVALGFTVGGSAYCKVYRASGNQSGSLVSELATGTPPYKCTTSGSPNILGNWDDDAFLVQYCQSADILYLAHPAYKPQVLKRTAKDTFTFGDFDSGLSGQDLANAYPYRNQNTSAITLTPSATTGTITLTASAALFNSAHVGAIFRIDHGGGVVGAAQITVVTNSTTATAAVLVAFSATTAKTQWWESAWSNYRGWPRSVCIFEQRLVMAGTTNQPDTLWFSQTANYNVFSVLNMTAPAGTVLVRGASITVTGGTINYPVDDSQGNGQTTGPTGLQPFRITLSQNQIDQIQWLSPDKELLIGTASQEWISSPQNGDFSIQNSPTVQQSKYGSDYLMAQRIGYELIFPVATQDEVRAYQYNYIDASFFAEPVQLYFDQYPMAETQSLTAGRRKFRQMQWDSTRQTLWCLDTAGNLFGMTRDRKLSVTMWHTHQMGGYNPAQGVQLGSNTDPAWYLCDGSVISIAVIPNPVSGVNDVWMVVKRTVGGTVNWQVERMIGKNVVRQSAYSAIFPGGQSTEPLLVDSAVIVSDNGNGTFNYTVGNYLNGYSPQGTYYSGTLGLFSVTMGQVAAGVGTLNAPVPADYGVGSANQIVFGLMFNSIIQPSRIDSGSVIGTAQAAVKRINRVFIRFFKTIAAKVGSAPNSEDLSALEAVVFNLPGQNMASSPELFSGDKKVIMPSTYERDAYLYLVQDQPLPFCVASIEMEGEEFD